jgi:hypothetical protein
MPSNVRRAIAILALATTASVQAGAFAPNPAIKAVGTSSAVYVKALQHARR